MRERLRRWLCAGQGSTQFRMVCNHCAHEEFIDARELTVQVSDTTGRIFLAAACERCRRAIATEITMRMSDLAMEGGAKLVHLVEAPPIGEREIRRFVRDMDAELAEFLS